MKKSRLLGALCVCLAVAAMNANAALVERLGGAAAYDDVLDITWVTNGALSGLQTWQTQVDWAANLDHLGFDDWRLATMSVVAGLPSGTTNSIVNCDMATELACRDNELGYMFYQNLGGNSFENLTGNQVVNGVTLTNIQSMYGSGTGYDSSNFWGFMFRNGFQGLSDKRLSIYGWAVRSGDVAAVPLPAAVWLFGGGLLGLIGIAGKKRHE